MNWKLIEKSLKPYRNEFLEFCKSKGINESELYPTIKILNITRDFLLSTNLILLPDKNNLIKKLDIYIRQEEISQIKAPERTFF